MKAKTRVLVVEDSVTVRSHIVEVLRSDPTFEVVAEAGDGRAAIDLCELHRPDVITMDMLLPIMNGLAATEWIMANRPTPIVIVSAVTRSDAMNAYDAIAAGAVDVLAKPSANLDEAIWAEQLKSALRIASRIKVVTHPRARLGAMASVQPGRLAATPPSLPVRLVAVGASTGGPGAVRQLLLGLPKTLPVPLLLVLHIGEPFDAALAEWLGAQSSHRVTFGVDGESPFDGPPRILMAPAARHMQLRQGVIRLDTGPERHSCRPSVDTLFESVASDVGAASVGVLMTGMGRDGAEGLLAMRRAGARTIAQDEATSVIYGMPRAAVEIGAAVQILPLDAIAGSLFTSIGSDKR